MHKTRLPKRIIKNSITVGHVRPRPSRFARSKLSDLEMVRTDMGAETPTPTPKTEPKIGNQFEQTLVRTETKTDNGLVGNGMEMLISKMVELETTDLELALAPLLRSDFGTDVGTACRNDSASEASWPSSKI